MASRRLRTRAVLDVAVLVAFALALGGCGDKKTSPATEKPPVPATTATTATTAAAAANAAPGALPWATPITVGNKGIAGELSTKGLAVIRPGLVPVALHPVHLAEQTTYTVEVQAEAGTRDGFEPTVLALTERQPQYEPADLYWSFDTWDVSVEEPEDEDEDEGHGSLRYQVTLDGDVSRQSAGNYVAVVGCNRCGERGEGPSVGGAYRIRITKGTAKKPWPRSRPIAAKRRGQAATGASIAVGVAGVAAQLTASELRQGRTGLSAYRAHAVTLKPETAYTVEIRRTAGASQFSPTVDLVRSAAGAALHGELLEPDAHAGLAGSFRRINVTTEDDGKLSLLASCDPCGKLTDVYGDYKLIIVEGTHRLLGKGLVPKPLGSERPLRSPQEVGELMGRRAPEIKPTPGMRKAFVESLNELCPDTWCEGEFNYQFKALACEAGKPCTLQFTARHFESEADVRGSLAMPKLSMQCGSTSDRTFCTSLRPTEAFHTAFSRALQDWEKTQSDKHGRE